MSALAWAVSAYAVLSLVSMATMSIGAALLAVTLLVELGGPAGLLSAMKSELRWAESRTYLRLSLVLALACGASLLASRFFPLSYGGKTVPLRAGELFKLWYLAWPLVILAALRNLKDNERTQVLRIWLGAFAVLSTIGIYQYFTGWPRPQSIPGSARYHATIFLGHHLSVASVFIFPFFMALDSRRMLLGNWKLPVCFLGFSALMLTYSRTLWVALPLGILVWAVWALPRRKAFGLIGVVLTAAVASTRHPMIQARLNTAIGIGDRQSLWRANLEFLQRRPLLGVGWRHNEQLSGHYLIEKTGDSAVFAGHAHNTLIDMLGGTGALGALAWLAWSIGVLRLSALGSHRKALVCAWVVFQLNGLTQVNFWEAKVQHQMMWIVAWSLFFATFGKENGNRQAETSY